MYKACALERAGIEAYCCQMNIGGGGALVGCAHYLSAKRFCYDHPLLPWDTPHALRHLIASKDAVFAPCRFEAGM